MPASDELSKWLNDYYKTKYCALTGRGTSAIYILLRALNHSGTGVLVPAVTCPAVIYAIILAGYHPVFYDINLDDFNLDINLLYKRETAKNISAVLAIHNFGHRLDIKSIRDWCNNKKVFLVEDVCQIMSIGNEGSLADAVVVSFGYSKPIDSGDGGALMLRDMDMVDAVEKELAMLPAKLGVKEYKEDVYRNIYYGIWGLSKHNNNARKLFKYLTSTCNDMYLYQTDEGICENVVINLSKIETMIQSRLEKSDIYQDILSCLPVKLPKIRNGSVPWRYTFMVDEPEHQVQLTMSLRSNGFNASNWYPSLSQDWGEPSESCSNADYFEKHVINLWVDSSVSNETVLSTARHVANYYS